MIISHLRRYCSRSVETLRGVSGVPKRKAVQFRCLNFEALLTTFTITAAVTTATYIFMIFAYLTT